MFVEPNPDTLYRANQKEIVNKTMLAQACGCDFFAMTPSIHRFPFAFPLNPAKWVLSKKTDPGLNRGGSMVSPSQRYQLARLGS